jgi:hypothetical protein
MRQSKKSAGNRTGIARRDGMSAGNVFAAAPDMTEIEFKCNG